MPGKCCITGCLGIGYFMVEWEYLSCVGHHGEEFKTHYGFQVKGRYAVVQNIICLSGVDTEVVPKVIAIKVSHW
jgi:hypothetical protein